MTDRPTPNRPANHLAHEKSPYLLQHQYNPVDWYPWGSAALVKARNEQRSIFLSIGYSTCHWCHVMERESFEDAEVAAFLNQHFVSIKVDREERPDVDKVYMTFVQTSTGQGGWPLNVFLTPELHPFFGGTYFPPSGRHGRPGFLDLLQRVQVLWMNQREDVRRSGAEVLRHLSAQAQPKTERDSPLSAQWLTDAAARFRAEYDADHGGFGHAPKFPRPSQPAFLLQFGTRHSNAEAVSIVLHTCERMAAGGIHDQLGGGFARYSVDEQWHVPHFEKMLYDNAQLAQLYLDAFLVSRRPEFAEVVHGILRYVLRDMAHPDGGFYSAEDADSEGKEGKFYCWTRAEAEQLLLPSEFQVATRYFGLTAPGNFIDHSDPDPLPGQNVLRVADHRLSPPETLLLAAAKQKLLAARNRRVRPHRDDKVLSSWNGLMLGALARAAVVLGNTTYATAARQNLEFLKTRLWDPQSQTLYHRWRDGERDQVQLLDAYAFLLAGVLDLYECTLHPDDLTFARELADAMIRRFQDSDHGGFWQSPPDSPDLILRVKEDYDGAEPSGNSVAALALLRLAGITGREDFAQAARRCLHLFADRLERVPQAVPHLLLALDFALSEPRRVVIAGDPQHPETRRLLAAAHSVYQPTKVILGTLGEVDEFARALPCHPVDPVAHPCTGTACHPATSDPQALRAFLASGASCSFTQVQ